MYRLWCRWEFAHSLTCIINTVVAAWRSTTKYKSDLCTGPTASYRYSEADNRSSAVSLVKLHMLETQNSKAVTSVCPVDVAMSCTRLFHAVMPVCQRPHSTRGPWPQQVCVTCKNVSQKKKKKKKTGMSDCQPIGRPRNLYILRITATVVSSLH